MTVAPYAQANFTPVKQPLVKKSLKWGMIKEDLSVLEKFKLIKKLGFDGIELDSPNDLNLDEVLEAKEQSGLEIPGVVNSVHWRSPLSDPDPVGGLADRARMFCIRTRRRVFGERALA